MSWFNRKTSKRKKQRFTPERLIFWVKRFGISLAVLTFVIWLGAWFFLSGAATATSDWTKNKILMASASMGFKLENILVEGRSHTDPDILLSLLNIEKGDPLLGLNIKQAQEQIEKISWVKTVLIQRRFPDTIYMNIKERSPVALWQRNGKLCVIDNEGVILTHNNLEDFKDLIIFTGVDANTQAGKFLMVLNAEPELLEKVEAAQYISERRWDLKLKNGLVIKLPEEDIPLIMAQLAKYQKEDGLLDKDIKAIDVRSFPSIIVQTHPGAAYSYQAQYPSEENSI